MTVREAADRCGISRQAVYKKINHSMKQELQQFTVEKDGVLHILPEGFQRIADSVDADNAKVATNPHQQSTNADHSGIDKRFNQLKTEYTDSLKEKVAMLKKELEHRDEEIQRLSKQLAKKDQQLAKKDELLERNSDLLQNFQVILRQNQDRMKELEGDIEESRTGFWERLRWWR